MEELKGNLLSILKSNITVPQPAKPASGLIYKSAEEQTTCVTECRTKMLFKLKAAERKVKVEQTGSRLEEFVRRPELLVGRKVMHQSEENGSVEWFHLSSPRLGDIKNEDLYFT